ncbi:hypothetical protein DVK02_00810 [Halobellus sp. Atlit-31R]|nr:hypothetical protein DVK02_00810 [Halobellus sp. Atlit-31R]
MPPPVERYVRSALAERKRAVDSVVLRQAGQVRTGDADSPWRPFTATQYVTTDPPGFLWDAAVRFAPLVSVRVRDLYVGGDGSASVSLAGAIPLDGAEASPELNEAELMRYLAEAVWYPTALLPRAGVTWSAIDDETAAATIECGGVSASLTFTFDGDEVRTVHSDGRYRRVDGRYERTPWTGHWRAYEMRNGFRVPTEGDVVWHLPDGDLHAWHGRLEEVSHDRR